MLAACTLRRLLHCGEWIGSHALHISMLHAPDFLGYPGVVEMASDHREISRALSRAGSPTATTRWPLSGRPAL